MLDSGFEFGCQLLGQKFAAFNDEIHTAGLKRYRAGSVYARQFDPFTALEKRGVDGEAQRHLAAVRTRLNCVDGDANQQIRVVRKNTLTEFKLGFRTLLGLP